MYMVIYYFKDSCLNNLIELSTLQAHYKVNVVKSTLKLKVDFTTLAKWLFQVRFTLWILAGKKQGETQVLDFFIT